MIISLIVAMDKNNAIGRDNKLLWHLSDDLKNFKKITLNKPIIMGRKTYDSIGMPLPKRENIVISRDKDLKINGVNVYNSIDSAIESCSEHAEVVVIGGANIYEQVLDRVDKMYVTYVDCELEADTFFPKFSESKFKLVDSYKHLKDDKNEYSWTFCEYQAVK